jgi:site-specific DNA recombinase
MVPDETLGPMVTEIFRRYAAGQPIADICRYAAAVKGSRVIAGNLKKLLRNPVYLGHVVAAGETLPGSHDPLVDQQTWQRVQDRLAADAVTPSRHLAPTWSLVGLCYCPAGHHLQRQPCVRSAGRNKGLRQDRLVCGLGRTDVYGDRCPGVGTPLLDRVEGEVLRQVADYARGLRDDHAARAVRKARLGQARAGRDVLERELVKVRAGMAKLARGWAVGDVPDAAYRQSMEELRRAEAAALAELAKLGPVDVTPEPAAAASAVEAMLVMWRDMTHAERGQALRTLVRRIVVRPVGYWREPEEQRVDVQFLW